MQNKKVIFHHIPLQWSRSPERAETFNRGEISGIGFLASMEPLSGESGNPARPRHTPSARMCFNGAALRRERKLAIANTMLALGYALQWSRSPERAETRRTPPPSRRAAQLQWSRSPERAETPRSGGCCTPSILASMEPLSGESGNAQLRQFIKETDEASMEPLSGESGNKVEA